MSKILLCVLLSLAMLLPAGCSREDLPTVPAASPTLPTNHAVDPALAAGEAVLVCGWAFDPEVELPAGLEALRDKDTPGVILDFQREVITEDIVHYGLVLSVGPGEHDVIGLHRVVRETAPGKPLRTRKAMFLVHGMGKDFVGNFLPGLKSPLVTDDFGFAVFMAREGIDVWGIDHSYTLVPGGLEDHSFAADWGMDKSVADIGTGLKVAQQVRFFMGNGLRKLTLVGYSQGAIMSYAFLNGETQLPAGLRTVGAFVPIDWGLAFDDPTLQANECGYLGGYVDLWNEGIYGFDDDPDGFLGSVGYLAQTEPYAPSPYYEGLTNLEVFLFFTAIPSTEAGAVYWGAAFDGEGWPLDFAYTTRLMATEFWLHWAPMHPPVHLWIDLYAINCEDSAWETHLGAIDLPVFSLGAASGGGPIMAGTLDRLVSADVTSHVVRLLPPEEAWRDFAHVDLFTAEQAPELAWQPLLTWFESLKGNGTQDPPGPRTAPGHDKSLAFGSCDRVPAALGRYFGAPAGGDRAVAPPADVDRTEAAQRLRARGLAFR